MWFTKRATIFKRRDKITWQKIKDILKSEGFKGVKSGHYQADSLFACGCGAKLDPRNFGSNGYIDRDVYFVDVRQEDSERAKNLLSENGIESVIDDLGNLGKV
ncbi:MAG: hypothetical protein IJG36_09005 [Synergistaceae bacterium]|nr:hypothetical protein [Synergistaceae bacterium]MBQ6002930.1 hypothetical protein [Synergistaceae bacterium]MBR0168060.1 hypothetical protein [Synergistaceae bacterium]MBR0278695.1 hypothetical protein [Synergistaceae bacterium]